MENSAIKKVPCKPRSILIAEDETIIQGLFVQFIEHSIQNIHISCAADGRSALERFFEDHHEIIILDSMLPLMNGEQVFDEMQSFCDHNNWQMPHVIFCTGFTASSKLQELVTGDSLHTLLSKPVRQADLIAALSQYLN